jgi:hypothetical protein
VEGKVLKEIVDRRRFWWFCAALVLLSLTVASFFQDLLHASYLSRRPQVPVDFATSYMAGKLARLRQSLYYLPYDHPPRNLYDMRCDSTTPYGGDTDANGLANPRVTTPFAQPPAAAMLMEPFSSTPWEVAYFEWRILIALACFVAVFFSSRLTGEKGFHLESFAAGVVLLTAFYPFKEEIYLGQIDFVILLAWALGTWLLLRDRPAASSFCFALATAIKIYPVLVVPLILMRRKWRWLVYYVLWILVIMSFSVWSVGWQNHVLWLTKVAPVLSCGVENIGNRSLAGFIMALCKPQALLIHAEVSRAVCWVGKALSALFYLGFLLWCWTKRKLVGGLIHELLFLTLVSLLVTPVIWRQSYLLAVPSLLYLWVKTYQEAVAATTFEIGLLAVATVVLGNALPEYIAGKLGTFFELLVVGLWVGSTVGLIWLGMRMYHRCVPPPRLAGE